MIKINKFMIHTTYISYISYKKDKKKADNIFLLVTLFKILYLKNKNKNKVEYLPSTCTRTMWYDALCWL